MIIVLSSIVIFGCRCIAPKTEPDPLAGWSFYDSVKMSAVIKSDYKNYIDNLPPEQKGYIGTVFFYQDGKGGHAVNIEVFEKNQNAAWQHVIIYDEKDRRVKVVRYGYHKYQS